jgi:hypothetical protein
LDSGRHQVLAVAREIPEAEVEGVRLRGFRSWDST